MLACSWLAGEMAVQHSGDLPAGSHPRPRGLSKRALMNTEPILRPVREYCSPLSTDNSTKASHSDVLGSKGSIVPATAVHTPASQKPPLLRRRGRPQPQPCETCHCGTASGKRVASFARRIEPPSPRAASTRAPQIIITEYSTDALAYPRAR